MDIERIRRWFAAASRSALTDEDAIAAWHILSARCRFVKTLPRRSVVLDVGAGDGALAVYRSWPPPARADIALYAFAMDRGSMFDRYDGYELGAWPSQKPGFAGRQFDAVFAANFIEHIEAPLDFIAWSVSRLSERGRIFLEWPTRESLDLPSATLLRPMGIDVMAGTYLDDATHRPDMPTTSAVHGALNSAGLRIEESGVVRVPFFEDHMMAIGKANNDIVSRTLAYWSFTGWCQYVIAGR